MTIYLEATYIAHDDAGNDSGGFHKLQSYCLELQQHWFGRITIRPTHGYNYKPLNDMRHSYVNLRAFLSHWKIDGVLNVPLEKA